jgi:hypothetical protein
MLAVAEADLPHLERLSIAHVDLDGHTLAAIVTSPRLPAVRALSLAYAGHHPTLEPASLPPALVELDLSHTPLGERTIQWLARDALPRLEKLSLNNIGLGDHDVEALCAASAPRLRELWVAGNALGDRAGRAVAGWDVRLTALGFDWGYVPAPTLAALAGKPGLRQIVAHTPAMYGSATAPGALLITKARDHRNGWFADDEQDDLWELDGYEPPPLPIPRSRP